FLRRSVEARGRRGDRRPWRRACCELEGRQTHSEQPDVFRKPAVSADESNAQDQYGEGIIRDLDRRNGDEPVAFRPAIRVEPTRDAGLGFPERGGELLRFVTKVEQGLSKGVQQDGNA